MALPSMRPRRFGRGEPHPVAGDGPAEGVLQCGHGVSAVENPTQPSLEGAKAMSLQCGHGVSAVENASSGFALTSSSRLQCGHGVSAVENAGRGRIASPVPGPSMRPRRFGRGEPPSTRNSWTDGHRPSMRPRRFGRGERESRESERGSIRSLQCGHGVSAVENAAPAAWHRRSTHNLQCGHGVSAVENGAEAGRQERGKVRPFNAATAFRPWRTARRDHHGRTFHLLQCGHGVSAVENSTHAARHGSRTSLQCGHGVSAVENPMASKKTRTAEEPSMRPRRFGRGEHQPLLKAE